MSVKIIRYCLEVIPWGAFMCLVCLLTGTYADNPCEDNIYLEVGTEGVVPCEFTNFDLVGWINGNGNHEETSPFIYLENSQVKGGGQRDYNVLSDGSLVIKSVQVTNDRDYTALYVPTLGPQVYYTVPVGVFVRPDPEYPVINGLTNQQYIVQDVMSSGSITCTLNGARPAVPLEWEFQSDVISVESEPSSNTSNNDGTYNTLLSSRFTIISQSVQRVTLKCKAAGELAHLFPLVTTIYLQLKRNFPVVNGHANQHHVVLELKREDELTCFMSRVPKDVLLQWVVPIQDLADELILQNETSVVNNEDRTANITLTSRFSVLSPSIRRVTLECRVSGQEADQYPDFTTVDVLISENYPIVNGHSSDDHIVLHLKREDELNCSVTRVSQDVSLEWAILTPDVADEIILEDKLFKTSNEDGTFDIRLQTMFSVLSHDVQHVTMECRVLGQSDDQNKAVTTVEVLIAQNYPIVNGHRNDEHIVLHLKREDELNCSVNGVSPDVFLEWAIITPDVADEIILKDKFFKISNEDGKFDVSLHTMLSVLSHDVQHVTMECRVSGQSDDQNKAATTVEVLIAQNTENTDINISGWTLAFVIAVFLTVIVLTLLTVTTCRRVKKSQKQIVWLCSMQEGERHEGVRLHRGDMNGRIRNSDPPAYEIVPLDAAM